MLQSYNIITKGAAAYLKTISEINTLIDKYDIVLIKHTTEPASDAVAK